MAIQTNHDVDNDNVFGEVLVHSTGFKVPPSPGSNSKKTLGRRQQRSPSKRRQHQRRAVTSSAAMLSPVRTKKTVVADATTTTTPGRARSHSPKTSTMRSPSHYKGMMRQRQASPPPPPFSFENDSEDDSTDSASNSFLFGGKSNFCSKNCTCDFCNVEDYYGESRRCATYRHNTNTNNYNKI